MTIVLAGGWAAVAQQSAMIGTGYGQRIFGSLLSGPVTLQDASMTMWEAGVPRDFTWCKNDSKLLQPNHLAPSLGAPTRSLAQLGYDMTCKSLPGKWSADATRWPNQVCSAPCQHTM